MANNKLHFSSAELFRFAEKICDVTSVEISSSALGTSAGRGFIRSVLGQPRCQFHLPTGTLLESSGKNLEYGLVIEGKRYRLGVIKVDGNGLAKTSVYPTN
jgi:hypothetical protein